MSSETLLLLLFLLGLLSGFVVGNLLLWFFMDEIFSAMDKIRDSVRRVFRLKP